MSGGAPEGISHSPVTPPPILTAAVFPPRLSSTGAPAGLRLAAQGGGFVFGTMRPATILAFLLVLTAGCLPAQVGPALEPSPTDPPASPTAPPIVPPTPDATPTATTPACQTIPGEIRVEELADPDLPRTIPYRVYLPPCYESGKTYPVVVLLHGLQLTDAQWDDLGVNETADRLIRQGAIPPTILVMPWERKGLEFESAIVDYLLPHIRSAYSGDGDRTTTAVGGISRGAGWALRIGLQHPEAFGAVGLHSPAVLVPDLYYLGEWIGAARAAGLTPELWIDIAERDTSRVGAMELASVLDELGVRYAWSTAPGEHAAPYWSSRMEDYLRWYAAVKSDPRITPYP